MGDYVSWIQLTITAALIVFVIGAVNRQSKKVQAYVDRELERMDEKVELAHMRINDAARERKMEYLREDKHALICGNRTLELKAFFSAEIAGVVNMIRMLEKKIDRLDGRTGFLKDKEPNDA